MFFSLYYYNGVVPLYINVIDPVIKYCAKHAASNPLQFIDIIMKFMKTFAPFSSPFSKIKIKDWVIFLRVIFSLDRATILVYGMELYL